jgi:hypothetical protein
MADGGVAQRFLKNPRFACWDFGFRSWVLVGGAAGGFFFCRFSWGGSPPWFEKWLVFSGFLGVGELLPNMNGGETGFSWLVAGAKWRFRGS